MSLTIDDFNSAGNKETYKGRSYAILLQLREGISETGIIEFRTDEILHMLHQEGASLTTVQCTIQNLNAMIRKPTRIIKGLTNKTKIKSCAECFQPAILRCGQCNNHFYCCKEHQKAHWPLHKLVCSKTFNFL